MKPYLVETRWFPMRKHVNTLQYFTGVLDKPVKILTKDSLVQILITSSINYHWTEESACSCSLCCTKRFQSISCFTESNDGFDILITPTKQMATLKVYNFLRSSPEMLESNVQSI